MYLLRYIHEHNCSLEVKVYLTKFECKIFEKITVHVTWYENKSTPFPHGYSNTNTIIRFLHTVSFSYC